MSEVPDKVNCLSHPMGYRKTGETIRFEIPGGEWIEWEVEALGRWVEGGQNQDVPQGSPPSDTQAVSDIPDTEKGVEYE